MEGRWTIHVDDEGGLQPDDETLWFTGSGDAIPVREVPVVPCDDAAIERIWPEIAKRHDFSGDYAHEIVCDVLRLAGETP